jgi:class 3 adenylate cyclase
MPGRFQAEATMDTSRHLSVILFTDIVGSVGLKNKFGTEAYSRLLARQRELFQESLRIATGGNIAQHTGDGFLAEFQTSSQAVNAALAFQYLLSVEPWGAQPLRVRVGIHQGEVLVEETHDPGQKQLVGLAVDLAARVMGLALGGQILLTRSVFDDARQYIRKHPEVADGSSSRPIRWVAHGRYVFKGMAEDESLEVCEVGAEGVAPLVTPPDGEKAKRAVAADEEETLGWSPAGGPAGSSSGSWATADSARCGWRRTTACANGTSSSSASTCSGCGRSSGK